MVFYEGNYSDYLARRPVVAPVVVKEKEKEKEREKEKAAPAPAPAEAAARRLTFKEQRELAGMEEAITAAEARLAGLSAALQDPALYRERGAEVAGLVAAEAEAQRQVEALYARWQELEALPR